MKPNYLWAGIALLIIFCTLSATAQQVKVAGVRYFNGVPTGTPSSTAGEVAIDTATGYLYMWQRDAAAWVRTNTVDRLAGTSAPGYVPSDKQSIFVVTDADSLYMYRSGAWRHLNAGGGGGGSDTNWSNSSNTATASQTQDGAGYGLELLNYDTIQITDSGATDTIKFTPGGTYSLYSTARGSVSSSQYFSYIRQRGAGHLIDLSVAKTSGGSAAAGAISLNATNALQLLHTAEIQLYSPGVTLYDYAGTSRGKLNFVDASASLYRASIWAPSALKHTYVLSLPDTLRAGVVYSNASGELSMLASADTSITNEGALSVGAATDSTANIATNTSGDGGVFLKEGRGVELTEEGDTVTVTAAWERVRGAQATGSSTTPVTNMGMIIGVDGTATVPAIGTGDKYARSVRTRYTSTAAINQTVGWKDSRQHASTVDGFYFTAVAGVFTGSASGRGMVGLNQTFTNLSVDRSTQTGVAMFVADAADANWQFVCSGSVAGTKVNTGISKTATSDLIRFEIWNIGGSGVVHWRITNLDTGATASGKQTSNIPTSTMVMYLFANYGTGTGATAVAWDCSLMELRTNY